jgi:ABC-type lipoprotein release transport system permease subunit
MINSLLIITGIILMVISVVQCIKLITLHALASLQWAWYVILGLIVFFLIGYIAYFFLNTSYSNIPVSSLLISLILFFGAIFVITILSISYGLISALTQRSLEIDQTNTTLTTNAKELEHKQNELKNAQELLRMKNKELVKTLDDFYTMRINIQKDMEAGKLAEENKKIKDRLDTIKEH